MVNRRSKPQPLGADHDIGQKCDRWRNLIRIKEGGRKFL
jgi:hypothetical protein